MKNSIITSFLMMCGSLLYCQSTSPSVIASSGSYFESGSISLATTIGEPIISTFVLSSKILTQGFQQPNIEILNSTRELTTESLQFSIFPNPSTEAVNIELWGDWNSSIYMILTDVLGKLVYQQSIMLNSSNSINLNQLTEGIYLIKLYDKQGNIIGTSKLHKLN